MMQLGGVKEVTVRLPISKGMGQALLLRPLQQEIPMLEESRRTVREGDLLLQDLHQEVQREDKNVTRA